MTPPIFAPGNKVEIIGVTCDGRTEYMGKAFKISQYHFDSNEERCSDVGLPWYPASSLRLVAEELKIGDWVEIVGQPCGLERKPIGMTGEVLGITRGGNYELANWIYPTSSLRKLTPEEVVFHTGTIGYKMQEEVAKAKDAVRKILVPLVNERLAPYQESIEETQRSMVALEDRVSAIEKEDWQKSIDVLMGERPEVHQIPNGEPIQIVIVKGDKMHTWCDTCTVECMAWCENVLDSMREG